MTNNKYFRAAAELIHGISAGMFPGAVWAAWMIRQGFIAAPPSALLMLERATVNLFVILIVALVLQAATGVFRLHYYQLNIRQGFLETKRQMVLIKHLGFVTVLVLCVVWLITLFPK